MSDEIAESELEVEQARLEADELLARPEHKHQPDAAGHDPRETIEDALDDPALQAPDE